MTLLPYAQKELAQCKADSLRSSFLIARGMANNHFGIMALDLDLDAILFGSYSFVDGGINEKFLVNKEDEKLSVSAGGFDDVHVVHLRL